MAFLGMRGTGDWTLGQRWEDWDMAVMKLFPNGKAPLTAIIGMMGKKRVTDPVFHWWEKRMPTQLGTVTGVFLDAAMLNPYAPPPAAATGTNLFINMSQADITNFRVGHTALLQHATDPEVEVFGKVIIVQANGAASVLGLLLLEADAVTTAGHYASDATSIWVVGSVFSEGDNSPESLMYDPVEYSNNTQIFKWAIEHTRTAMQTELRTGDQVKQAKQEALELYSIEMEKAFIFRRRTQRIGTNGKIERTTRGIKDTIVTHRYDFLTEPGITSWAADGEDYLDDKLELMFRFGSEERLALCGSLALMGINRLIKGMAKTTWELTATKESYGINVFKWITPFGTLNLKTHPLFNYVPALRRSMLVVQANNLRKRIMQDTVYEPEIQDNDMDGKKSQYKSDVGLEVHFEETHGWFDNIGADVP